MRRVLNRHWLRLTASMLSAMVTFALAAPPALAIEPEPARAPEPKPITEAVNAKVAAADPAEALAPAPQAAPVATPPQGSFFKSPKGIIAVAILVIGAGYATYSLSKDRTENPIRK